MKKKVLFLVNHEIVIYNFRKELVEKLLDAGYEVYISSPNGEKINELVSLGCIHIDTNISRHGKNPVDDIKLTYIYVEMIKKIKPLIVLTYTIKPNIYGGIASVLTKTPYVANITGLGTALEKKGFLQKITKLLYKFSFIKIKKVYFQNEENKIFFEENKLSSNNYLLPGSGVNLNQFKPLQYSYQDGDIHFVFISRIMKEKGIELYLEAARKLKEKYPWTHYHICGFCEENYEEILESMQRNGIIKYHGMIKDIRTVLRNTHCTVHPSNYPEGLSNALLESAAAARPIITTNRSGCRELVDHGINGYLVEPENVKDLIEKMDRFINLDIDIRREMGKQSRKKVEKNYDRKIVVEEYMETISSV